MCLPKKKSLLDEYPDGSKLFNFDACMLKEDVQRELSKIQWKYVSKGYELDELADAIGTFAQGLRRW